MKDTIAHSTIPDRFLREIETGLDQLAEECRLRKRISVVDPVTDGIAYATGEIRTRLLELTAPGQELTPAITPHGHGDALVLHRPRRARVRPFTSHAPSESGRAPDVHTHPER